MPGARGATGTSGARGTPGDAGRAGEPGLVGARVSISLLLLYICSVHYDEICKSRSKKLVKFLIFYKYARDQLLLTFDHMNKTIT